MPMRAFADTTGWETAYEDTLFTAEALAADDDVATLAKPVDAALAAWETLEAARRKARRAVVRANARVHIVDGRLDRAVSSVADAALGVLGRRAFADPLYKRLFPTSPSSMVALGLESELKPVARLLEVVGEKETPAPIKAAAKSIPAIVKDAAKVLAERTQAENEAEKTSAKIAAWKRDANAARLGVQGKLLDHASKQRLPKAFADDYFPAAPREKSGKKAKDAAKGGNAAPK